MRLGLALSAGDGPDPLEVLAEQAVAAEEGGVEIVWLEPEEVPAPLLSAAALAARTRSVRIAACTPIGDHPLAIAEAAAVADCCSAGRLILALDGADGGEQLLAETADALLAATKARPFVHVGSRWRIPGARPENDGRSERVVVTPSTVQVEMPLWLCGRSAPGVARARCLCSVSAETESTSDALATWTATEQALGPAAARLPRAALRVLTVDRSGAFDERALVARLRDEQRNWGLEVAIVRPSRHLDGRAWRALVERISRHVRPLLVQDDLPDSLVELWRRRPA